MTLSVRMGAGEDGERAARVEAEIHAVVEDAALLDVVGDRAAAQPAVLLGRGAPRRVALPVAEVEALVQDARELAAVVVPEGRRRVRQLLRRDEIAAPDFRRIDADHPRRLLDQALGEVGGLGPPRAAIGAERCGVREQALRHHVDRLHVVRLGDEAQRERGHHQGGPDEIGADRVQRLRPDAEDLPVPVQRHLAGDDLVAAGRVEQHALRARRDPLHRAAAAPRRPQHQRLVGAAAFHAEAAADVRRHYADPVFGQVEDVRHLHPQPVRVLRARVEGVRVVGGVVVADRRARLHRARCQAVVLEPEPDDVLRARRMQRRRPPSCRT